MRWCLETFVVSVALAARWIWYNTAMILKHRDRELLRFVWVEPQGVRVLSVNESERTRTGIGRY